MFRNFWKKANKAQDKENRINRSRKRERGRDKVKGEGLMQKERLLRRDMGKMGRKKALEKGGKKQIREHKKSMKRKQVGATSM